MNDNEKKYQDSAEDIFPGEALDFSGEIPMTANQDASDTETEYIEITEDAPKALKPSQALKKRRRKSKNPFIAAASNIFPWKGDSRREVMRKSVFLGCIVVLGISGYFVLDYFSSARRVEEDLNNVRNQYHSSPSDTTPGSYIEGEMPMLPEAQNIVKVNSDIVGWIKIDDTRVDLPVLQGLDNDFYLDRDFKKEKAEYGSIFLDYRNKFTAKEQSDNLVIYGHDTSTNAMFGDLDQYYYQGLNHLITHPYINLNSNYRRSKYIIFGVIITNSLERDGKIWPYHNILDFGSEDEFDAYVLEAKKRSIYKTYLDVKYGDKLITLSTCATNVFADARLVIVAREVREGEDPAAYTSNYENNPNPLYPDRWYMIRGGSYKEDPNASY